MKPTLPTNFKDDILNTSVEGKRRYRMIYNDDNTVSFVDVTPYDQTGSDFGAGDINLTNEAVNQSADAGKIIDDPETAEATTEEGYIAGVQLFNHVNDSLTWKLHQTITVKETDFDLPTSFNELLIIGTLRNASWNLTINIPYDDLTSSQKLYTASQYISTTVNGYIGAKVSKTKLQISCGGDSTTTASFEARVYYR